MRAEQLSDLVTRIRHQEALQGMRLHRVYFYDAAPFAGKRAIPLRGGETDFRDHQTYTRSQELHQALRVEPFVALRMGELLFRGWTLDRRRLSGAADRIEVTKDDLKPVFQQKGVDMRLGLDIASLTLKKLVRVIVLVAGDSDFVPAMKFARREGAQLFLVPLGSPIRDPMREHADLVLEVGVPPGQQH